MQKARGEFQNVKKLEEGKDKSAPFRVFRRNRQVIARHLGMRIDERIDEQDENESGEYRPTRTSFINKILPLRSAVDRARRGA